MKNEQSSGGKKVITVFLGLIIAANLATSYTISRNRILSVGPMPLPTNRSLWNITTTTTTTLPPPPIVVDEAVIREINSLRPRGESWAYQEAYWDAINDFRIILKLKKGTFSRGPTYPRNTMTPEFQTCFCYNSTYAKKIESILRNVTRNISG